MEIEKGAHAKELAIAKEIFAMLYLRIDGPSHAMVVLNFVLAIVFRLSQRGVDASDERFVQTLSETTLAVFKAFPTIESLTAEDVGKSAH